MVAMRMAPKAQWVPLIMDVLARDDSLDLYGQKIDHGWHAGVPFATLRKELQAEPRDTLDVWMCRWRVKQAACHALGAIGEKFGPQAVGKAAVETLCRYATTEHDYQVRAAACLALGQIGDPAARAALEEATHYEEWCTIMEARKALARIGAA